MVSVMENTVLMQKIKELLRLKVRFALTSSVATLLDYGLYLALVYTILPPVSSNIISYSIAVLINFTLQKRFIFDLQRKVYAAFLLSIAVSLGGLLLSTGIIFSLSQMAFFSRYQFITKLVATALVFFYNFYLKRYAFEKRFL
jgi:putative flippase GtrA